VQELLSKEKAAETLLILWCFSTAVSYAIIIQILSKPDE